MCIRDRHQLVPKEVAALRGTPVAAVSAGYLHSLALTVGGDVFSWGRAEGALEGDEECFEDGVLGHGDAAPQLGPKKVEALSGTFVAAVSAGYGHSLAVTVDGAMLSWGKATGVNIHEEVVVNGGLGHGDDVDQLVPRRIEALDGVEAVHVAAGYQCSFVVDAGGTVHAFGKNGRGDLGLGDCDDRVLPTAMEALTLA